MRKLTVTFTLFLVAILVMGASVSVWRMAQASSDHSPVTAKVAAKKTKHAKKAKKQKKATKPVDPTQSPPAPKLPSCIQIDGGDFAGRYDFLNDRNTAYYRNGNTCIIGESDYWIVTDCTPWKTGSLYFNAFDARNPIDAGWRGHGEFTDTSLNVSECQ